jgi:GxxExxY protein
MDYSKEEYEKLFTIIVNSAYEVHKELGPGLLESVYEECLYEELTSQGVKAKRQFQLPIIYKGRELEKAFYVDILVENKIIIELKAVEELLPIHEVQLMTYMRLSEIYLGALINFNVPLIKNGIRRKINGYL